MSQLSFVPGSPQSFSRELSRSVYDTAQFSSLDLRLCKRSVRTVTSSVFSFVILQLNVVRASLHALYVRSADVSYDAVTTRASVFRRLSDEFNRDNVTGGSRRSPTATHVSRVRRAVDSGSGPPAADRQADPTTTSKGAKSRASLVTSRSVSSVSSRRRTARASSSRPPVRFPPRELKLSSPLCSLCSLRFAAW